MQLRKLQFNCDYTHILTFKDYYRKIVYPTFSRDNTQYAIDAENTQLESIRLIFPVDSYSIQVRRDGMTLIYEGELSVMKRASVATDTFFELYEKVKKIPEFTKAARQKINMDFVQFHEEKEVKEYLRSNPFISHPLKDLVDFGIQMDLKEDERDFQLRFGKFSESDIARFNMSPLNSEYNQKLKGRVGLMAQVAVQENTGTISHSRMKDLIAAGETIIERYLNLNQ